MKINVCIVHGDNEIAEYDFALADAGPFLALLEKYGWDDSETGKLFCVSTITLASINAVWVELKETDE